MRRSIQKLEELNVGMEEVQPVRNGKAANATQAPGSEVNLTPEPGKAQDGADVVSSTPHRAGAHGMPPLDESPVLVTPR